MRSYPETPERVSDRYQAGIGSRGYYDLRRVVIIAIFAAITIVLGLIEAMIPLQLAVPEQSWGLATSWC